MILIECAWCESELALESLDAATVECADCRVTLEFASDPEALALAA
jgi:hypothetical protein